jgi:MFS family permease
MILSSPALGMMVDRFGPTVLTTFMSICGILGTAMLVAAVAIPYDNLLYVAFICIGFMTTAASIMTVTTGMVFADDESNTTASSCDVDAITATVVKDNNGEHDDDNHETHHQGSTSADDNNNDNNNTNNGQEKNTSQKRQDMGQSRVISLLNALFDAGSVTYLGLWGISELGVSISVVFGMYLALAVFCFGGALLFWLALGDQAFPSSLASPQVIQIVHSRLHGQDREQQEEEDGERITHVDTLDKTTTLSKELVATEDTSIEPEGRGQMVAEEATTTHLDLLTNPDPPETTTVEYIPVCERTPKDQLLSLPFVMLAMYFAVNMTLNQFVLTTTRDYLLYLDDTKSEQYLAIFTLLMPVSILGIPFADQMIARYGYHAGLQTVLLLASVHGMIILWCDQLNGVQIFGFVVFSFYRCFLFSIVFSYVPTLLSGEVVGKGVGAMHFIAGIFSFWNIPLSQWAVTELDGNFFIPNLLYTLLLVPCSAAAWMIGRSIQQETLVKDTRGQHHQSATRETIGGT